MSVAQTDTDPIIASAFERPLPLIAGTHLDRFEIVRLIGSGGSADVYEAVNLELGRRVALKILRPGAGADDVERFHREARTSGAFWHVNIASVFDVGHTSTGDLFLVMELLEGEALDSMIARGALPIATAMEIALQLTSALEVVHAHGIVHGDVKPENMVIQLEGGHRVVKLFDFGVSKLLARTPSERPITLNGMITGTPPYMAPELIGGATPATAGDVYAVGVVLYECLTGRVPFEHQDLGALLGAILQNGPPPVTDLRPDCPKELADIVARAMALDPAKRFDSMQQMHQALVRIFPGLSAPAIAGATLRFPPPSPEPPAAGLVVVEPTDAARVTTSWTRALLEDAPLPTEAEPPLMLTHRRNPLSRRRAYVGVGAGIALFILALGIAAAGAWATRTTHGTTDSIGEARGALFGESLSTTGSVPPRLRFSPVVPPEAPGSSARISLPTMPAAPDSHATLSRTRHVRARLTARDVRREAILRARPEALFPFPGRELEPPSATNRLASNVGPSGMLVRAAFEAYIEGHLSRAEELYHAALHADPNRPDAWRGLGAVSAQMGHREAARAAYVRYLRLVPSAQDAPSVRRALHSLE